MHREEQNIHNPLLGTTRSHFKWKCTRQYCVSSKPVLLILIWNFLVSFTVALFTSPDFYNLITSYNYSANLIKVLTFGLSAFPLFFYPLATCLADRKWGRYKTIVNSLYCLLCSATIMCAFGGVLAAIMVKRFGSQTLHIVLGVFILRQGCRAGQVNHPVGHQAMVSNITNIRSRANVRSSRHR